MSCLLVVNKISRPRLVCFCWYKNMTVPFDSYKEAKLFALFEIKKLLDAVFMVLRVEARSLHDQYTFWIIYFAGLINYAQKVFDSRSKAKLFAFFGAQIKKSQMGFFYLCSEWESNPHSLRYNILSVACIPIPPSERFLFKPL